MKGYSIVSLVETDVSEGVHENSCQTILILMDANHLVLCLGLFQNPDPIFLLE